MHRLGAQGISVTFDPACGFLRALAVEDAGRTLSPMHRAPWVGLGLPMPPWAAPHLAGLEGDFFCAPFGEQTEGVPLHGWPANGDWQLVEARGGRLVARLPQPVQGARLEKTLQLRDGQPFLYQLHRFEGGEGTLRAANHAMVSLPSGGRIAFSPKRWFHTPAHPPEADPTRWRSALAYPARAVDPRAFPGATGPVDLTRYPWGPAHEDFVIAVEAGPGLGWTAVVRPSEGDLFLSLRNAAALPMTMLWHSNGGRDYAPWSGRHRGCLGVEEGAALTMLPDLVQRELAADGMVGLVQLGGTVDIAHAIGAIAWPTGEEVAALSLASGGLQIDGVAGARRTVAFDAGFLGLG
jgi:hypothetical protein